MRATTFLSSLVVVVLSFVATEATAATDIGLANSGFEQGLDGWQVQPISITRGYQTRVVEQDSHSGKRCLEISHPNPRGWGLYGRVTQTVSAEPYRGKRVRFGAAVRSATLLPRSYAALYARVHRRGYAPGHFADMADRGIRNCADANGKPRPLAWQSASVIVDVAPDAERLEVGFYLNEAGVAWFDDAVIQIIGPAGAGNEPPRALSDRGLENLTELTRLYGYVRYFHPSDEVAALGLAGWDRFAIEAINLVEQAKTPEALATVLGVLFAPYAPSMQVFPTGQPPDPADLAAPKGDEPIRLVAWVHMGGASNYQVGSLPSHRQADRQLPGASKLPLSADPLRKPEEAFTADLGAGVSCRVPLVLYADARGTRPKATAKPWSPGPRADFPPTGDDRSTRLGGVVIAWNIGQHFYPYLEEVGTDWPAVLREALTAAATDADAAAYHRTLRRLVAKLHDGHGVLRGGSGAPAWDGALELSWDWIEDSLVIVNFVPRKGTRLQLGTVVTAIDGVPTTERIKQLESLVSGSTPQFVRYRAMQDLRIGPAGQRTTLRLLSPQGEDIIATPSYHPADDAPLRGPGLREARLPRIEELRPGYFYVDLDRFQDAEFGRDVLPQLANAKGVVFDVRGYPTVGPDFLGHFAAETLSSELYQMVITRFPDHRDMKYEGKPWAIAPKQRFTAKAAFLTDGRAVSYAETFMALVARHRLGPILGGPTSGTNGGVNVYVLPDGSRLSWTAQKARNLDGSRHHGIGILPTVPVRRTIKAVAEGRDEVIEKALELIQS